jgi:hypothetical protein
MYNRYFTCFCNVGDMFQHIRAIFSSSCACRRVVKPFYVRTKGTKLFLIQLLQSVYFFS